MWVKEQNWGRCKFYCKNLYGSIRNVFLHLLQKSISLHKIIRARYNLKNVVDDATLIVRDFWFKIVRLSIDRRK